MERVAVIGLGYVGLPVAIGFARAFPGTIGFDIAERRVHEIRAGLDRTGEVSAEVLRASGLAATADPEALRGCTFFIVAVPTPIDDQRRPDLEPLRRASEMLGRVIGPGAVIVFESTVYPGVTESFCGPILARVSGLTQGRDFKLGYSPERINPGDTEHRLETIVKVVSGEDTEALDRVAAAYGRVVTAGVHRAPSIAVAEAAKVIENTQRDLNIALMNELALIFDRLGISTRDVLAAARTKWNFLPFTPGLVGGHCIGVDPYYLTARAEEVGYHPEVILAGRRINDGMGAHIAQRVLKALSRRGRAGQGARIGVLGLTFKEDVPDLRNSRVPDIVREFEDYGAIVHVHDPHVSAAEAEHEWGFATVGLEPFVDLDALVIAVSHRAFREVAAVEWARRVRDGGVVFDVKWSFAANAWPEHVEALSL
jgi:UDP-N-acetyl-D-galactosamine dehydrogenase